MISNLFSFNFISLLSIQNIAYTISTVIFPNMYLFLFIFIILEEMGVPMPIPGEFFVFLAGYRVALGDANPITIILIVILATIIGSTILYSIIYWQGLNFIEKYGKYIFLSKSKILQVKDWFSKNGLFAILIGRWIFGLRIIANVIGGLFRLRYDKFISVTIFATIIWTAFYVTLGVFLGQYYPAMISYISQFNSIVIELIYFVLLTLITALFIRIIVGKGAKEIIK